MYATAVDALINLSGYNEHYYFQPKMDQRLEGPAANFLEANPFAADENFGDAAIGWVMGRLAGAMSINPILGKSHAAYLLIRGIAEDQAGKYALVVNKDNVVEQKRIKTGQLLVGGLRVITEGLAADDRVVLTTNGQAVPGGKVVPKQETIPPPPPGANITTTK